MHKYLLLPLLIVGGMSQSAYAAKFNLTNYLFKSDSKSGVFVGVDHNTNSTTYYNNYYQKGLKETVDSYNKDYDTTIVSDSPYTLTYGFRFYIPKKKSKWSKIGIGFKGWYSNVNNDFTRKYYGTGNIDTEIEINATVKTIGYEGQIYYDILNFETAKIAHSIGIALGAGYETKSYNDYQIGKGGTNALAKIQSFSLNSIIYDASLYYTFANHHRFEVGYKMADYGANIQNVSAAQNGLTFVADSEVTPLNKYYYLSYSFQF